MKELLKTILTDYQRTFPRTDVQERQLRVPLDSKKIITLIGPRRCGKTFYLFQIINQLVAQGRRDRIIYINFEDERLTLTSTQLQLILEAYYELYPQNYGQELYLFFDEIQEITGWEKFVRRLYDTVTKNIFVTGSSAKMLGKEIATGLRGRNIVYNLFTLSFEEYCRFQDIDVTDVYSTPAKTALKAQMEKYIRFGGYPEIVFMNPELAQKTLQSYFDVMLFRDIVERHAISNVLALKQFLKKILNNISSPLSVNKFYNELKSQGIAISKNTIYDFLDHGADCFLLFLLLAFEPSAVKQQLQTKKVYAIDTGLVNAISYRYSEDKGKLLENIVFLQLLRSENAPYFLKNNYECDFLIQKDGAVSAALQVCLTLQDEKTRQREIRGLAYALDRFKLSKGYIITLDEEDELAINGKKIFVRPSWKWLLAGSQLHF